MILGLHTLTEDCLKAILSKANILKLVRESDHRADARLEVLAECAFRLRDKFMETHTILEWKEAIKEYMTDIGMETGTWTAESRPIHWVGTYLYSKCNKGGAEQ